LEKIRGGSTGGHGRGGDADANDEMQCDKEDDKNDSERASDETKEQERGLPDESVVAIAARDLVRGGEGGRTRTKICFFSRAFVLDWLPGAVGVR